MSILEDLKKSISEESDEELAQLFAGVRQSRTTYSARKNEAKGKKGALKAVKKLNQSCLAFCRRMRDE